MTVTELIEHLKMLPPEATVIYKYCSDYEVLDKTDIEFLSKEESHRRANDRPFPHKRGVCFRRGRFCEAYPIEAYPDGESPVYVDVVTFPGN